MTIRCRFHNQLSRVFLLVVMGIGSIGIVGWVHAEPSQSPMIKQDTDAMNPREPIIEKTSGINRLTFPVQRGVRNILDNLDVVRRLTNNIFQLNFTGAAKEVTRFTINSTMGVGGLLDIAKDGFNIEQSDQGEWVILNWVEEPAKNRSLMLAEREDRTAFLKVFSFEKNQNNESWTSIRQNIQEGDLIAYRKDKWEARKNIFLKAQINQIGYRLFKYGHLAIAIRESDDENTLRLLSSQALKGPNIREDIATLKNYSWDVYRLNRWDRVDKMRFYEFVNLVRQKAERWYGYDFPGVFGLWNSNLRPIKPQDIGRTYSCSTVILAALYYAGLELDAFHRSGIADIITPLQIVRSKGRIVPLPEITMQASSGEMEGKAETLYAFQRWD